MTTGTANLLHARARTERLVGATAALLEQAGFGPAGPEAACYTGMTIDGIASEFAGAAGVDVVGLPPSRVLATALTASTSDFPKLLQNVANGAALRGYAAAPETFASWTAPGSVRNFLAAKRAGAGQFPTLDQVREGGEFRAVSLTENGESVQLLTYGKAFPVSRAALLADDLGEIARVPLLAGRAAARLVGDLAYSVLTTNANLSDNVALFHASHGNLMAGAAISAASIAAMDAAIAAQVQNGVPTRLRLRYLLVPVALEFTARAAVASIFGSQPATITVVGDHRLDEVSATAWYGAADPLGADTVELSYLNGLATPTTEIFKPFNVDGTIFRVRHDVAAKALDFRGLAKNPGA